MPLPVILLDEPLKTIYPGETVTGNVVIQTDKPFKARSVTVNWGGFSETTMYHGSTTRTNIFNGSDLLWASNDPTNELSVGTHKFPFEFTLPNHCPPSLNTLGAKNEYKIEVEVDRPWKLNTKVHKDITVNKRMEVRCSRGPVLFTKSFKSGKIFNCGPVTINVTTPTRFCNPGQTIDLKIKVANTSSASVDYVYATLSKQVHCHSRNQHHECNSFYWNNNCPLGTLQKTYRFKEVGTMVQLDINLEPYSEGTYVLPVTIPTSETTPNFATGAMTFGYFMEAGFKVKGSVYADRICFTMYIAEQMKFVEKKKAEKAEKAKEATKEEEAPPAYNALKF